EEARGSWCMRSRVGFASPDSRHTLLLLAHGTAREYASMNEGSRTEKDSMGPMIVPASALWGASTQRAVENFPISGYRFNRRFIRAIGLIKLCAAEANAQFGTVGKDKTDWIVKAAHEVIDGKLDEHFVLDIFQTGSGTSTNMNANEVIAHRAVQLGGGTIKIH